jgi:hypothetical protein
MRYLASMGLDDKLGKSWRRTLFGDRQSHCNDITRRLGQCAHQDLLVTRFGARYGTSTAALRAPFDCTRNGKTLSTFYSSSNHNVIKCFLSFPFLVSLFLSLSLSLLVFYASSIIQKPSFPLTSGASKYRLNMIFINNFNVLAGTSDYQRMCARTHTSLDISRF